MPVDIVPIEESSFIEEQRDAVQIDGVYEDVLMMDVLL
jgi:hypothetical protein